MTRAPEHQSAQEIRDFGKNVQKAKDSHGKGRESHQDPPSAVSGPEESSHGASSCWAAARSIRLMGAAAG
jgi:hypothetical protein